MKRRTEDGPTVRIALADARAFTTAFESLSRQARVAFVTEGLPLKTRVSEASVGSLVRGGGVPLDDAARELAAVYDYEATRTGGVFLLRKRYSDPADLPGLTLAECRLALRDLLRIAGPFVATAPAGKRRSDWLAEFAASLTPRQLELMEREDLPLSDITPRQRARIWSMALDFYLGDLDRDVNEVLRHLDAVTAGESAFCWEGADPKKGVFGYEVTDTSGRTLFRSLNRPRSNSEGPFPRLFPQKGEAGYAEDPTDPSPNPPLAEPHPAPRPATLATAAAILSKRSREGRTFVVDEALAAKPVHVIGGEAAPAEDVLAALAAVYGLRVVPVDGGKTLRLTRRHIRAPQTVTGLPDALRRALPDPLVRALHVHGLDAVSSDAQRRRETPTAHHDLESVRKQDRDKEKWEDVPGHLRFAGVRRLRATLEPKIRATKNGEVRMSALDEPEESAFANALVSACSGAVQAALLRNQPDYIVNFGRIKLLGGPRPDDVFPSFVLKRFEVGIRYGPYGSARRRLDAPIATLPR